MSERDADLDGIVSGMDAKHIQESAGGAAAARVGRSPAAAAKSLSDNTPPLTNRGCLTPLGEVQPVLFHLDYLKQTIFAEAEPVLQFVESALLDRAGLPSGGWIDKGPVSRWQSILVSPCGVTLLVPKDQRIVYTILEIKGEGCARVGAVAISSFLKSLSVRDWRWHGLRIDLAFDHVLFDPYMVDAAVRAGDFNSRCLNIIDRDWHDSATGQTAYLGARRSHKQRRLRVYNKRAYNRCEGEFQGDWAKAILSALAAASLDEWPTIALGYMRGMVDFVDHNANDRPERCPLLPWWSEFVGGVKRIRNLPEKDRRKEEIEGVIEAIKKAKLNLRQCSRRLWPLIKAFGGADVVRAIVQVAEKGVTEEDRRLAGLLAGWMRYALPRIPGHRPDLAELASEYEVEFADLPPEGSSDDEIPF